MFEPLSREFLLNRGFCCKNGCLNCPYEKENNMEVLESIDCKKFHRTCNCGAKLIVNKNELVFWRSNFTNACGFKADCPKCFSPIYFTYQEGM